MKSLLKLAGAVLVGAVLSAPMQAQTTVYSAGDSTSGTYMDYMKTVYARAGNPATGSRATPGSAQPAALGR